MTAAELAALANVPVSVPAAIVLALVLFFGGLYLFASGLTAGSEAWHKHDRQKALDEHIAYKAKHPRDCGTSWIPPDGGEAYTFSSQEIKSGRVR